MKMHVQCVDAKLIPSRKDDIERTLMYEQITKTKHLKMQQTNEHFSVMFRKFQCQINGWPLISSNFFGGGGIVRV